MLTPDVLTKFMDTNLFILGKQLDGLTHDDSLLQLPFRGNCLNWIMGHIVQSRDTMLRLLECDVYLNDTQANRYKPKSEPITSDGDDVMKLDELWDMYRKQDSDIRQALDQLTADDLDVVKEDSERTLGDRLRGLLWHESYHVGQTEFLRQLAGKNDGVV